MFASNTLRAARRAVDAPAEAPQLLFKIADWQHQLLKRLGEIEKPRGQAGAHIDPSEYGDASSILPREASPVKIEEFTYGT